MLAIGQIVTINATGKTAKVGKRSNPAGDQYHLICDERGYLSCIYNAAMLSA